MTYGPAVARAAELMGSPLYPWQRFVVDVALEVDADGEWAFDEVVITVPRQSGKTFLVGPVTAQRCAGSAASVWMTAQKGKSKDRWLAVVTDILRTPLRQQVKFTHGVGNERLLWRASSASFRPFPPNGTAMHGESPDLVWVDELWTFNALQRQEIEESYRPAWSVKSGQSWLMSTAGTQHSEWLNQVRRRGRDLVAADRRDGVAYFEWSAPESVGGEPLAALDDDRLVDTVLHAHPRRDHGLRVRSLRSDLERRPRDRWIRDYANVMQADDDVLAAFPADVTSRARSGARIPEDARVALGVSVDPDRRDAAIGFGWRDASGVAVTTERRGEGARWVAGAVIKLVDEYDVAAVAVTGAGPARSVADELDRAGVPLLRLTAADYAAAGSGFADEFAAARPSVTHDGMPGFAQAVSDAKPVRRPSGIVFESRSGASIVSLDARVLAVWAADHAPVPAPRIDPAIW